MLNADVVPVASPVHHIAFRRQPVVVTTMRIAHLSHTAAVISTKNRGVRTAHRTCQTDKRHLFLKTHAGRRISSTAEKLLCGDAIGLLHRQQPEWQKLHTSVIIFGRKPNLRAQMHRSVVKPCTPFRVQEAKSFLLHAVAIFTSIV